VVPHAELSRWPMISLMRVRSEFGSDAMPAAIHFGHCQLVLRLHATTCLHGIMGNQSHWYYAAAEERMFMEFEGLCDLRLIL
jgi:hypothetical protein